jgi:hypothetical protein
MRKKSDRAGKDACSERISPELNACHDEKGHHDQERYSVRGSFGTAHLAAQFNGLVKLGPWGGNVLNNHLRGKQAQAREQENTAVQENGTH